MENPNPREGIEKLAQKYELLARVRDRETTLEQEISNYEKEFFQISKRMRKAKREQTKEYTKKLCKSINLIKDFNEAVRDPKLFPSMRLSENLDFYVEMKGRKNSNKFMGGMAVGGIATTISGLLLSPIFPVAGVIAYFTIHIMNIGILSYQPRTSQEYEKLHKKCKEDFTELKIYAQKIDKTIQKTYITDHYQKNDSQIFKNIFQNLSEQEKEEAIQNLLKKDKNKELDSWLTQNYPKIIEKAGRDLIQD